MQLPGSSVPRGGRGGRLTHPEKIWGEIVEVIGKYKGGRRGKGKGKERSEKEGKGKRKGNKRRRREGKRGERERKRTAMHMCF